MSAIHRTDDAISRVLNKAADGLANGTSDPGMSYEAGILDFAFWLFGEIDDEPLKDQ